MTASDLVRLTDQQLAEAADAALAALAPRARAHALAVAAGKPAVEAAREAGTSTNGRVLARMKARTRTALALLREQQRRKSQVTADETARWFEALADDAWRSRDFSAARGARREAALIRGIYPEARLRIEHELIDAREVTAEEIEALSLLRHGVRRQLPVTIEVTQKSPAPENGPENRSLPGGRSGLERADASVVEDLEEVLR